jgi:hypothetical protein
MGGLKDEAKTFVKEAEGSSKKGSSGSKGTSSKKGKSSKAGGSGSEVDKAKRPAMELLK